MAAPVIAVFTASGGTFGALGRAAAVWVGFAVVLLACRLASCGGALAVGAEAAVRRGVLRRTRLSPAEVRAVNAGRLEAAQADVVLVGPGLRRIGVDRVELEREPEVRAGLAAFVARAEAAGARVQPEARRVLAGG
ncbi:MAG: hypothetical protein ACKVWR_17830 [Acidimicrobiales bacterium]